MSGNCAAAAALRDSSRTQKRGFEGIHASYTMSNRNVCGRELGAAIFSDLFFSFEFLDRGVVFESDHFLNGVHRSIHSFVCWSIKFKVLRYVVAVDNLVCAFKL